MLRLAFAVVCMAASGCAATSSSPTPAASSAAKTPHDCALVGRAAGTYSDFRDGVDARTMTDADAADKLGDLAGQLRDVEYLDETGRRANMAARASLAAGRLRVLIVDGDTARLGAQAGALGRAMDALSAPCL